MRIWLDPDRMLGLNLTTTDVILAIEAQNTQVAAGRIGAEPSPASQQISARVLVKGQPSTPAEFGAIVLRANPAGSNVRLRAVPHIEFWRHTYTFPIPLQVPPGLDHHVTPSPPPTT